MLAFITALPRAQKQAILLALDLGLVLIAFGLVALLHFGHWPGAAWMATAWPTLAVLMLTAAVLSVALGIPHIQLKSYELSAMRRSALLAVALAGVLVAQGLLGIPVLPPGDAVTFALLFLFLTVTVRMILLQLLLVIYRSANGQCRVLIYGAGSTGMQLALALKAHAAIRPVAFIDDNPVLGRVTVAGLPVYPAQQIEALIRDHGIGRVLLAMPSLSPPRQAQIARRIADLGVEVQALPSFAQLVGEEAILDKLAPVLPAALLGRQRLDQALRGGCGAWRGKSVLISGAGGSIGSELCRQILNCRPARLVLLELSEFALYTIDRELRTLAEDIGCEIVPVLGTVTDRRQVRTALEAHGVQVVLHAAAYKHVPMVEANALAGLANNVLGTATIAQEAAAFGVERFILVSTDKAVRPKGIMGASKRLAELVVCDLARRRSAPLPAGATDAATDAATASGGMAGGSGPAGAVPGPGLRDAAATASATAAPPAPGTVFAIVRFGNVLGSSGSVIPLFREQIARGGPVTLTHPDITRYFMTVQEATQLVLRAGSMARGGEIFVLDMGAPVRIADLARQVIEASGYAVRDALNPQGDIDIVTTGLREGEKLHEELSVNPVLSPTGHPKISCAHDAGLNSFQIARALQSLRKALAAGDAAGARAEALHWTRLDLDVLTGKDRV